MIKLHIASTDKPYETVKRRLGITNVGLYCDNCGEFFAIAIFPPDRPEPGIEFISDGLVLFDCPFCNQQQSRQVSDILQIVLTESNRRKPKPPPNRK